MNVLVRLCKENPLLAHCYAVYYLTREPGRTEIVSVASGSNIDSYALVWYGDKFTIMNIYEIHVWKPTKEVVLEISVPPDKRADIQLYNSTPRDVELVISQFKNLGFSRFHVEEFHDMICTRESFMPSLLEKLAMRLRGEHSLLYRDLERDKEY